MPKFFIPVLMSLSEVNDFNVLNVLEDELFSWFPMASSVYEVWLLAL